MASILENRNSDFQVGDLVKIVGDNGGFPGGFVVGLEGKIYTLREFVGEMRKGIHPEPGYWRMVNSSYVWHCTQFKLVNPRKAKTRDELRKQAKELKIPRWYDMRKAALQQAIMQEKQKPAPPKPLALPPLGEEVVRRMKHRDGCCAYAMERENGERIFHTPDVCHARLKASYSHKSGSYEAGYSKAVLNIEHHYRFHPSPEQYQQWVEMMLSHSPFCSIFLTKDFDEALKGGVYVDVKAPLSQVVAAAIALREGSEYPQRIVAYSKLIEAGVLPKAAYFVSLCFSQEDANWRWTPPDGAHCIFALQEMEFDGLLQFLRESFHMPADAPFKSNCGLYHVFDAICPGTGYYSYKKMQPGQRLAHKEFFNMFGLKKEGDGFNKKISLLTTEQLVIAAKKLEALIY